MSTYSRRGFTLIELLVVVVIIGILASIAVPRWQTTKGKANTAALKSDLRNLTVAQESYFYENQTYTTSPVALGFTPSQNVALTFVVGSTVGWSATASHAVASPTTCGVYYGSVAAPISATTAEGQIACQ